MIEKIEIKHLCENQYSVNGYSVYDTELLVYTTGLVDNVKKRFDFDIPLNDDVRTKADYYRGKKVYGNIHMPKDMYVEPDWGGWRLITAYDFDNVKGVYGTYDGVYSKEDVIKLAQGLADYVNTHDILTDAFYHLMTYYDMSFICDSYTCALKIIRFYKPFVDIKKGITDFLKIANKDYPIDINKLSPELKKEISSYGLI